MEWPSSAQNGGWTALMAAAHNGHRAVVSALVAAGADATLRTAGGWDAVGLALRNGNGSEAAVILTGCDAPLEQAERRLALSRLLLPQPHHSAGGVLHRIMSVRPAPLLRRGVLHM
jgi:hypothetical protein